MNNSIAVPFSLESSAFKNRADIPEQYTGHGKDISPPLKWNAVPPHTQEFALICEDPDAPNNPPYIHWVVYHIPAQQTGFDENASKTQKKNVMQGKNSRGEEGYTGPNPPEDSGVHRYYFRLFALDAPLQLGVGATVSELMEAMRDHVLGEAEVMGRHEFH